MTNVHDLAPPAPNTGSSHKEPGMQMRRIPGRVVLFAGTLILLGAIGVRADRDGDHHRRVEVTFTKWVLNGGAGPFMLGVTGGDAEGVFAGEVLNNLRSARLPSVVN